jgi:hypothetical protein
VLNGTDQQMQSAEATVRTTEQLMTSTVRPEDAGRDALGRDSAVFKAFLAAP